MSNIFFYVVMKNVVITVNHYVEAIVYLSIFAIPTIFFLCDITRLRPARV